MNTRLHDEAVRENMSCTVPQTYPKMYSFVTAYPSLLQSRRLYSLLLFNVFLSKYNY